MSKHETSLTRQYWDEVGGTLVEEFPIVKARKGASGRWIDALILLGGPNCIAKPHKVDINGQDVIVVQTKARRLGMNVMGQAVFSAELIRRKFSPKSVRAVIVCTRTDEELHALLDAYPHVEVKVLKQQHNPPASMTCPE